MTGCERARERFFAAVLDEKRREEEKVIAARCDLGNGTLLTGRRGRPSKWNLLSEGCGCCVVLVGWG